jgi:Icc-related predicted phosphoesterase
MDADPVKTRFLILSDTHNAIPASASSNKSLHRWPLPKADVLLHAGDLTMTGKIYQHHKALELIKGVDAEIKIVIPGNHDMSLHREYCRGNPIPYCPKYDDDQLLLIDQMYTGPEAKAAGIEYMVEGIRTFQLKSGAKLTVYANVWQPEFHNWAFNYPRSQDRFNPSRSEEGFQPPCPVPDEGIDIMVTHGPPAGILDACISGDAAGCVHLFRAVERSKPRLHVFGHIHEAWGAVKKDWRLKGKDGEELIMDLTHRATTVDDLQTGVYYNATKLDLGNETLFVNASIMDVAYTPSQAPWVVDLLLPRAGGKETA